MPIDQNEKVRENRLRRTAERRGYGLSKSRRRDEYAVDFGQWKLTKGAIKGEAGTLTMQTITFPSLDAVEAYLSNAPIEIELRAAGRAYIESRGKNSDDLAALAREAIRMGMAPDAVAFAAEVPAADIRKLAGGGA